MVTVDSDLNSILALYDIGAVQGMSVAGGTAGKTWKVTSSSGDFFLRLRGMRTSSEARLRFDHGLRDHLIGCGVPTAASLATKAGARWVRMEEGVYELYPFVVGRSFDPESEEEIAAAARGLAEYHRAAAEYRPLSAETEPIAQYTTLGFSDAVSERMDDPGLQRLNLEAVRGLAASDVERQRVDRCIERVEGMQRTYAGVAYERLSGWVIHGDFTPANLLFSDSGQVVGIFDLDWALPGARCRDLGDGLYFFATRPREIDAGDIWSLTEVAEFDEDRCRVFLKAYQSVLPLERYEFEAIPLGFAGRWISIRLEGMAKVEPDEGFRFFSRGIEEPLRWLDVHWAGLGRG
jgi:Ser/Thr protein kinase RdoA (MazF antagonist)